MYQAGVLTCPVEKRPTLRRSLASEMTLQYFSSFSFGLGPILSFYSAFLRQSSHVPLFDVAMVQHFYRLGFYISDQVLAGSVPAWGRAAGTWLTLLRHSPLALIGDLLLLLSLNSSISSMCTWWPSASVILHEIFRACWSGKQAN